MVAHYSLQRRIVDPDRAKDADAWLSDGDDGNGGDGDGDGDDFHSRTGCIISGQLGCLDGVSTG